MRCNASKSLELSHLMMATHMAFLNTDTQSHKDTHHSQRGTAYAVLTTLTGMFGCVPMGFP